MKKLKYLILIVLLLLVSACGKKTRSVNPVTEDDELLLTLYSHDGDGEGAFLVKSFGHTFMALKNLTTDKTYTFMGETLTPGDEISFGAWGIDDNFAIWFNLEAQYQHKANRYDGIASLSIGIDEECVDKINEFIPNHNEWTFFKNCTYFALNVWNLCCDENEKIEVKKLNSPGKLSDKIKTYDTHEISREMIMHDYAFTFKDGEKLYYYLEEKDFA